MHIADVSWCVSHTPCPAFPHVLHAALCPAYSRVLHALIFPCPACPHVPHIPMSCMPRVHVLHAPCPTCPHIPVSCMPRVGVLHAPVSCMPRVLHALIFPCPACPRLAYSRVLHALMSRMSPMFICIILSAAISKLNSRHIHNSEAWDVKVTKLSKMVSN